MYPTDLEEAGLHDQVYGADVAETRNGPGRKEPGRSEDHGPTLSVLILALSAAIGLGISRFGYALILPDMRSSLGWSYSTAGLPNTFNAVGYLVGAMIAPIICRTYTPRTTVILASIVSVLAVAACGLTDDFTILSFARAASGISSAVAFVAGGLIAAEMASQAKSNPDRIVGLFYAGPGIGIFLSGLIVPSSQSILGAGSWQSLWLILAAVSGVLLAIVVAGTPSVTRNVLISESSSRVTPIGSMWAILLGYCLFGGGCIGYMTFMFAQIAAQGAGVGVQTAFWCVIGSGAFVATWMLPRITSSMTGGRPVAVLCAFTAIGSVIPLLLPTSAGAMISAAIFGSAFPGVVGGTTAFVRRHIAKSGWPRAIGAMTVAFSVGQVLGPPITGWVSDVHGNLRAGLLTASGLLLLATFVCCFQRAVGCTTAPSAAVGPSK